jgi:hypothetical protein
MGNSNQGTFRYCSECGTAIGPNSRYCHSCGIDLRSVIPGSPHSLGVAPQNAASPALTKGSNPSGSISAPEVADGTSPFPIEPIQRGGIVEVGRGKATLAIVAASAVVALLDEAVERGAGIAILVIVIGVVALMRRRGDDWPHTIGAALVAWLGVSFFSVLWDVIFRLLFRAWWFGWFDELPRWLPITGVIALILIVVCRRNLARRHAGEFMTLPVLWREFHDAPFACVRSEVGAWRAAIRAERVSGATPARMQTEEPPRKEPEREWEQQWRNRRLASPEEIALLINPALDVVFRREPEALALRWYDARPRVSGPDDVVPEWNRVESEFRKNFDKIIEQVLEPLRAVRDDEHSPLMEIHLGTESLVSHHLGQVMEEAYAFAVSMAEGNPRKARTHEQVAQKSQTWVETIKPKLAEELRKLKQNDPVLFSKLNISENN